jgi:glycogen(starch) synthase
MRILVISNYLPPRVLGGFELACYNISKGLIARGHEVLILTSPTEKQLPEPQPFVDRCLSVVWPPLFTAKNPDARRVLAHQSQVSQPSNSQVVLDRIRDWRPDHILTFNVVGLGGLALLDLIDGTGIPWTMNLGDRVPTDLVVRVPEEMRAIYGAGREGTLFQQCRISAVSETLVTEIEGSGVKLAPNPSIIPRGVIMDDVVRTRPYRDGGVTRFVSAGALLPHKGLDLILDAAALLKDEAEFPFTIDVFGDGRRQAYQERAESLGLSSVVTFHGAVAQSAVIAANADSDAFLFPTWEREPGASTPIEAGVAGSVTIMTGNCGPAEQLVDGIHCIKIQRTVPSLADAMRRVGRGQIDLEAIGAAARRLAKGRMSFAASITRLEEVLLPPAADSPRNLGDRTLDAEVVEKDRRALALLSADLERR